MAIPKDMVCYTVRRQGKAFVRCFTPDQPGKPRHSVASSAFASASAAPAAVQASREAEDAKAVSDASALLAPSDRPSVPVIVVDPAHITPAIGKRIGTSCAVSWGSSAIYIRRDCPVMELALDGSPFGKVALAAVVAHEAAHIKGADEAGAIEQEIRTFTALSQSLDGQQFVSAREHLHFLQRRLADVKKRGSKGHMSGGGV